MKIMKTRMPWVIAVLTVAFIIPARAQLLDFDFSFYGNADVTGEIVGLENNATSSPTSVMILTAPNLDINLPYTIPSAYSEGTFTVSNDVITAVNDFYYPTHAQPPADFDGIIFSLNEPGGFNQLSNFNAVVQVVNSDGFAGVDYTYSGLAAPEPRALLLALIGGFAFLFLRRLMRKSGVGTI